MYRYEDVNQWIKPLLPIQRKVKPYVTVEQCRQLWKLKSKSAAHARLLELIERGMAERVKVANLHHYHIKDGDK